MFDDVIELLLGKKATLREELEREFAKREEKIDKLLYECGYVEPVAKAEEPAEEVAETVAEEQPEPQVIY